MALPVAELFYHNQNFGYDKKKFSAKFERITGTTFSGTGKVNAV